MGASARVALRGCDDRQAHRLFRKVESVLRQVEGHFSLHRESELTRLNRDGRLTHPDRSIVALFNVAGAVHGATGGAFDPSVQPLWLATALDGDARSKFSYAVFAAEFGRGQSIDSEEFVSGILREMGAPAETLARAGSPEVKAALRDSVTEAGALSIFGAPSFTTEDGELFWGFDRLAAALDWARDRA